MVVIEFLECRKPAQVKQIGFTNPVSDKFQRFFIVHIKLNVFDADYA